MANTTGKERAISHAAHAARRLLIQATHLSVASLFTMIAGLVTFPILTRIFSVEDYGVMNLVAATITVSVAAAKVGVQHSIIRYHSEISAGKSRYTMLELYSTTFFGMIVTAGIVTMVLVIGLQVVPARWLDDVRLRLLIAIASLLIVIQVLESALINFVRAEQRTALLMKYSVAKKYLGLGLILGAVLLLSRTLHAFYSASVLAEGLAVGLLAMFLFRGGGRPLPAVGQFSRPLYFELLGFGIPMMIGYELAGIILAVGDRYVIAGLIGDGPLGLYGAAYNLCQYIQAVFIASVGQAIMPIYMQMWDQKGKQETSEFISRSLRTYVLLGMPVIAGLAAVGPELLPSLASDKYASAASILPWVIAGMVVDGANSMLGAGLFIHRKTRVIMAIVLSGAILNLGLNLILVPRIGIEGSAIATLVCYAAVAMSMALAGHHLLPVKLPWATILRTMLASALMYVAVVHVHPGQRLITVGVQLAIGGPVYALVMLAIDRDARDMVKKLLARFRSAEVSS